MPSFDVVSEPDTIEVKMPLSRQIRKFLQDLILRGRILESSKRI